MDLVGKCAKSAATDFLVLFNPALYKVPIGYFGDTGYLQGQPLVDLCRVFVLHKARTKLWRVSCDADWTAHVIFPFWNHILFVLSSHG